MGKSEEIDLIASSLWQSTGSPTAAAGCAIGLWVLQPEGRELWGTVGSEVMGTREVLGVP